jgi:hypothetical protein
VARRRWWRRLVRFLLCIEMEQNLQLVAVSVKVCIK